MFLNLTEYTLASIATEHMSHCGWEWRGVHGSVKLKNMMHSCLLLPRESLCARPGLWARLQEKHLGLCASRLMESGDVAQLAESLPSPREAPGSIASTE